MADKCYTFVTVLFFFRVFLKFYNFPPLHLTCNQKDDLQGAALPASCLQRQQNHPSRHYNRRLPTTRMAGLPRPLPQGRGLHLYAHPTTQYYSSRPGTT
jgi:hypothetical protein